jgi:hypothetical protein
MMPGMMMGGSPGMIDQNMAAMLQQQYGQGYAQQVPGNYNLNLV